MTDWVAGVAAKRSPQPLGAHYRSTPATPLRRLDAAIESEKNIPRGVAEIASLLISSRCSSARTDRDAIAGSPRDRLAQAVVSGRFSLEELTEHYVSLIYAAEGRYDQAASRLGMDWRTLKQKLNPELVNMYADR